MSGQQAPNVRELSELQGEGGSDVFTSTRHVNNTNQGSSDFKLKFFTQDDAPIIRPLLKTKPAGPQVSMGVNTRIFDGYGGIACERVTKVSGRSSFQTMAGFGLIILSGTALCALLVHFKAPKKSIQ